MKKTICILFVTLFALATLSACGKEPAGDTTTDKSGSTGASTTALTKADPIGKYNIEINIKDYGTIAIELDGDNAPITVANFLDLAGSGYYDSLTFHRIIKNFMIQGGDPTGTGGGGSGKSIKGEFINNGVDNPLLNTRGAIAMARQPGNNDSATSQFFIVHQTSPHLDGDYAVFGYVTSGMDIVDKICEDTPVVDQNGTVMKENQPMIISVKVID